MIERIPVQNRIFAVVLSSDGQKNIYTSATVKDNGYGPNVGFFLGGGWVVKPKSNIRNFRYFIENQ